MSRKKRWQCNGCGKFYDTYRRLNDHQIMTRKLVACSNREIGTWCSVCDSDKSLTYKAEGEVNEGWVLDNKFQCTYCIDYIALMTILNIMKRAGFYPPADIRKLIFDWVV